MKRMMPYRKCTDSANRQDKATVAVVGVPRRKQEEYESAIKAKNAQNAKTSKKQSKK